METLARLTRRQVDVLQAVHALETPERGAALKSVAALLRLRPSTALGHATPLEAMGLLDRYRGKSRLTAKGRTTLVEYQRHHRIAEHLFDRAGLTPQEVCDAAREVDLALSHRTIDQVCRAEGHPATCPHGEPIPACGPQRTATTRGPGRPARPSERSDGRRDRPPFVEPNDGTRPPLPPAR